MTASRTLEEDTAVRVSFPRSPDEAAEALAQARPGAVVIGGGTLAVPHLGSGGSRRDVVDLGRIGADHIEPSTDGALRLGALVSYQQVLDSPLVAALAPLLVRVSRGITGGLTIRSQGTLAGALCAARPHSDMPAVLVALDAWVTLRSRRGTRDIPVAEFLLGASRTAAAPDEFAVAVTVPRRPPGERTGYHKLKFAESSWPVVTASALLRPGPDAPGEVVLGGVARRPLRVGVPSQDPDDAARATEDAVELLAEEELWSDRRAGPSYRRRVAGTVSRRAVLEALTTQEGPR